MFLFMKRKTNASSWPHRGIQVTYESVVDPPAHLSQGREGNLYNLATWMSSRTKPDHRSLRLAGYCEQISAVGVYRVDVTSPAVTPAALPAGLQDQMAPCFQAAVKLLATKGNAGVHSVSVCKVLPELLAEHNGREGDGPGTADVGQAVMGREALYAAAARRVQAPP